MGESNCRLGDREKTGLEQILVSIDMGIVYPPAFHGLRPLLDSKSLPRRGDVRSGEGVGRVVKAPAQSYSFRGEGGDSFVVRI